MIGKTGRWGWTEEAAKLQPHVDTSLLCFDRVEVDSGAGNTIDTLMPEVFLSLPIDTRIRLNMERKLRFMRGGQLVPSNEAMRSLIRAARSKLKVA